MIRAKKKRLMIYTGTFCAGTGILSILLTALMTTTLVGVIFLLFGLSLISLEGEMKDE